jgi:NAD(P)-dependent dehydrogenase (short-subunit alcohol dehydrogenase family)
MEVFELEKEFQDKNVLITGGSTGIGFSTAKMFCEQGANVVIISSDKIKLGNAQDKLSESGTCLAFRADVSSEAEMKAVFDEISNRWGVLDVIFANAGANGVFSPIEEFSVEDWDRTFAVNTRGTFLTLKYAIPMMKKQKHGSIIINASINGTRCFTNRGTSAYSSSKSAQTTLGKIAALELAPFSIRVNVICPGATSTNIEAGTHHIGEEKLTQWLAFPNGVIPLSGDKWSTPEQVAQIVLFLAGERASVMTGAVLFVDGGQSLIM